MVLSSSAFPNATDLKKDTELGRLTVFSTMGKTAVANMTSCTPWAAARFQFTTQAQVHKSMTQATI